VFRELVLILPKYSLSGADVVINNNCNNCDAKKLKEGDAFVAPVDV